MEIPNYLKLEVLAALKVRERYLRRGAADPYAPKSREVEWWIKLADGLKTLQRDINA